MQSPVRLLRSVAGRMVVRTADAFPQLVARHSRPGQIVCLLTERCSAKCVHCDVWRSRGREEGPIRDEWQRLFDEVRDWLGPVHVVLTGGEALLKPFTVDLLRYAVGKGLQVELLTHGYWRDQALIESVALADPWRLTLSLDGIGPMHDRIRGRAGFFERTHASIETLMRVRRENALRFEILIKTVIMSHNLSSLADVAKYASERGMSVLYQPIEQNYGQTADADWTATTENWPPDVEAAAAAIEELIELKRHGLSIANSELDFRRMIAYFRDPDRYRVRIQNHDFSGRCSGLGLLQVQANGDVKTCFAAPPIGNFRDRPLRELWTHRPHTWKSGCCLDERMSSAEKLDCGRSLIS